VVADSLLINALFGIVSCFIHYFKQSNCGRWRPI